MTQIQLNLTKQIEKITRYSIRKQNVKDEIKRLEKSDEANKEKKIEKLKKRDTLGKIGFDSVVISDFGKNLKVLQHLCCTQMYLPTKVYFITLNQWFDESLLKETKFTTNLFSINK